MGSRRTLGYGEYGKWRGLRVYVLHQLFRMNNISNVTTITAGKRGEYVQARDLKGFFPIERRLSLRIDGLPDRSVRDR